MSSRDPSTASNGQSQQWRPSDWLRALAAVGPARWSPTRSLRAAVGVTSPVVAGVLAGEPLAGMWVSLGALLLAVGERPVGYGARFRQIFVCAPLAASAFLLGTLSLAPPVATVAVMATIGFGFGVLSGYSHIGSVATMQAMLIAALAIGSPAAAPYWPPLLLYLVGAGWYAALLTVEVVIDRRRPERQALVTMLRALATLAGDRATGAADLAPARARALSAIDAYGWWAIHGRGVAWGRTRESADAGRVARAADQLLARLLAPDADRGRSAAAAARLTVCAAAVARRQRPPAWSAAPGTLTRLAMLESAIWQRQPSLTTPARTIRRARLSAPGSALLSDAGRLALCTALGYAAFYAWPLPHGHWIPMTVALVMKPDLGSVFGRAVLRCAGTIAGALIALMIGELLGPLWPESLALAVVAAFLPWAVARSYAWQTLVLTTVLMVLLDIVIPEAVIVGLTGERILAAFAGGLIVIVAGYLLWPSTRHADISEAFAAALTTLAQYARAVATGADSDQVTTQRRTTYQLLSDAHRNLQRRLAEPPPAGREAWAWIPPVHVAEQIADGITGISASSTHRDTAGLAALADDIDALAARDQSTGREQSTALGRRAAGQVDPHRSPTPPGQVGDSTDPAVRDLADEVACLAPMLRREPHPA